MSSDGEERCSELDDVDTRNEFEVAHIMRGGPVAEFKGRYPDQKIG